MQDIMNFAMTKIISSNIIFLAIAVLATLNTFAHDFEANGIYYNKISSTEVEVTYKGMFSMSFDNEYAELVEIPNAINHNGIIYNVIGIGPEAFFRCANLASIIIPNSITYIGNGAFRNCSSLTDVTIPNSVSTIGPRAFQGCKKLTSITIPCSTIFIEASLFEDCDNLSSIVIPNTILSIGDCAFKNCTSLTSIIIPSSVSLIGKQIFYGCNSLTTIDVEVANKSYSSIDGVLFNHNKTELHVFPSGKTADYVIPNSVALISDYAFYNCIELTSVMIPNSVTNIGNYAFNGCSKLTSIYIPNSVSFIGKHVFESANGCLTSIDVDYLNTFYSSIDGVLFNKDGTELIMYPNGRIGDYAIPNTVSSICSEAFIWCKGLTSLILPNSVKSIYNYAFNHCDNLTQITIFSTIPPTAYPHSFDSEIYKITTLSVPNESLAVYHSAPIWCNFTKLTSRIYNNTIDNVNEVFEIWTIAGVKIQVGKRIEDLLPGIYLIKQGNAMEKVIVK